MPETLTESFCERCGTRYEFKAPTRLNPLRKTRGFIGGLKNYLTSQDAMGDAMSDAMRIEEEALAAAQLDAFHESFNFCIDCRQYTCINCWNHDAGRCRTCVPVPGTDDLGERLAAAVAGNGAVAAPEAAIADEAVQIAPESWPSSDLPTAAILADGDAAAAWPDADVVEPAALRPEPEPEPEPVAAEIEPMPVAAEIEPEPVAAEIEPPRLRIVAWDEDAAYELVDPTPVHAELEAEVEPEPEPVVAEVEPEPVVAEVEPEPVVAEVEPEPVVAEVEPEPVVAEVEPEPEPTAPRIAPISETILRFPARGDAPPASDERVAAADESPEVAARRAQLDLLGLGDPGQGPVEPERPAVVPYRSRGAGVSSAQIAGRGQGSSFWEASAREVAGAGSIGVQNCGQCGLSLSANARFCRRCGTRQAQSA